MAKIQLIAISIQLKSSLESQTLKQQTSESKKSYPMTSYFLELYWIDDHALRAQLASKVKPQAFLLFIRHRVVEAAVRDFISVTD